MRKSQKIIITTTLILLTTIGVVYAQKCSKNVIADYDDIKITLNGNYLNTTVDEPFAINGRTYVPARLVAEAMGGQVGWNQDTKTVTINNEEIIQNDAVKQAYLIANTDFWNYTHLEELKNISESLSNYSNRIYNYAFSSIKAYLLNSDKVLNDSIEAINEEKEYYIDYKNNTIIPYINFLFQFENVKSGQFSEGYINMINNIISQEINIEKMIDLYENTSDIDEITITLGQLNLKVLEYYYTNRSIYKENGNKIMNIFRERLQ